MKDFTATTSKSVEIKLTPPAFWHSINILVTKPHVVNKRLWGCKLWKKVNCKYKAKHQTESLDKPLKLEYDISGVNIEKTLDMLLNNLNIEQHTNEPDSQIEVIITELLPKSVCNFQIIQLIVINRVDMVVSYYDITQGIHKQNIHPDFPYQIKLADNEIVLNALCESNHKSFEWLTSTVLPQVVKWAKEYGMDTLNHSVCKESLSLVSQTEYYVKYNELKLKYGKEMVKIWPECTDPSKFVYEDVAIATYLLLLWDNEHKKKQRFVDLGCGNGLLVYILTKEGHTGVGIDVRKRNIWDMYTEDVVLQEKTIVPSDSSLFPDTDWLIGNHSDELTPWIPVIAAKSSYNCNFFLLPCCAYNFDGTKYQRKNSFKSQYTDYLEHIKDLCEKCGFNVSMDRLKIPSTKRICLVGRGRKYYAENQSDNCELINEILKRDTNESNDSNKTWIGNFKARETVERVRNCTQIDKGLIESIVKLISNYLLDGTHEDSNWNAGKIVDLGELIKVIPQEQLKQLKSECGGLQTLLKNNHNIFMVQGGKVQLRYPKTIEEVNKKSKTGNMKTQQKPCWFYNNHPQGCPLLDTTCSFLHVKS